MTAGQLEDVMTDPFAHLAGLTKAATDFVGALEFADLDAETLRISRRCVLDGLAVSLAGSAQPGMQPLLTYIARLGVRTRRPFWATAAGGSPLT